MLGLFRMRGPVAYCIEQGELQDRSYCSSTSTSTVAHPVSVLILHPRQMQALCSHTTRPKEYIENTGVWQCNLNDLKTNELANMFSEWVARSGYAL